MEKIKIAAKQHSICVALGFSERTESNSLYIAQAIISPQGELVMKRRKLKPTHMVGIFPHVDMGCRLIMFRSVPSLATDLARTLAMSSQLTLVVISASKRLVLLPAGSTRSHY
jgi:hypothetical protein